MRVSSPAKAILFAAVLAGFGSSASALTVDEIRNTPNLTPKKFAALFRNFDFKFRKEVQTPDVFLATESGDCDDYSTLAASILQEKGYTPRLITVRMPGVTHVVCYVEEIGGYLDYNNRTYYNKITSCGSDMDAIADSVAKSYRLKWTSASEFTFEDRMKRLVKTVMPSEKTTGILASILK